MKLKLTATILSLLIAVTAAEAKKAKIVQSAQYAVKAGKLEFRISEDAAKASYLSDGVTSVEGSDFWRLILDDGDLLEIPVLSSSQKGWAGMVDGKLVVSYDTLVSEYGVSYPVSLKITVEEEDGLLKFTPTVVNGSGNVRVNECFCPLADFERLYGEKRDDIMYWPAGMGSRFVNPWKMMTDRVSASSTRTETEVSLHGVYPRLSMGWFGVQSGDRFLYVARYDKKFRFCFLTVRQRIGSTVSNLMMGVNHMPMARPGETVEIPSSVIGMLDGDWREGARRYRAWADANFFKVQPKADWVRDMKGWHRISLRGQNGEIRYDYEDLPRLYEEGRKYGLNAIFLFSWWKEGMDRGYPAYTEPYPWAWKVLAENIRKVKDMGGHVILVCNAHFLDPNSDFYKEHRDVVLLDTWGNEFRRTFGYSGMGDFHVDYAGTQFPIICFGTKTWRNQVMSQMKFMGDTLGADCVFADCIGGCPFQPCFNDAHEHGNRVDEAWVGNSKFFGEARDYTLSSGKVFGTEVLTDIAASYTQFIHSLENAEFKLNDDSFPAMFRYTFPEVITNFRKIQLSERPTFFKQMKYALTQGVRADAALFGCRRSIDTDPKYSAAIKFYTDKLEEYKDFYLYGRYTVIDNSPLPASIKRGEYLNSDGTKVLRVLYDTVSDWLTFDVFDAKTYMK